LPYQKALCCAFCDEQRDMSLYHHPYCGNGLSKAWIRAQQVSRVQTGADAGSGQGPRRWSEPRP
jgi:hypothetical protein